MTTETQTPADASRLDTVEAVLPYLATKEDVALIPHLATKEDIAKIAVVIPHLATKEDIAKIETKVIESKNEILGWMAVMFTAFVLVMGLLITLMGLLTAD